MGATFFRVSDDSKSLAKLQRSPLADLGFTEPGHLETWLASAGEEIFGRRRVLWIARQDRPTDEHRSDLVGIDELGNLLLVELKRGWLGGDAILQALTYAAEYARRSVEELVEIFAAHSAKAGTAGLIQRAKGGDAEATLGSHVGENEVNQSQILVLIGEDFSANALAVCDYLNNSSGDASFSVECWRYGVFVDNVATGNFFAIEQVLPPPNVRAEVEEKREASKSRKYARNPNKKTFMRDLLAALRAASFNVTRETGESYGCHIEDGRWAGGTYVTVSIHRDWPVVWVPAALSLPDPLPPDVTRRDDGTKGWALEYRDVSTVEPLPSTFADTLAQLVRALAPGEGTQEQAPA
jgi:hypothetical protein